MGSNEATAIKKMIDVSSCFPVEQIRQDFPMLQKPLNGRPFIYLDSAAAGQKPQVLIDRLAEFYAKKYGKPNEKHTASEIATSAEEETRQKVADLLKARDKSEIIFLRGTTEAINVVASGFEKVYLNKGMKW